MANIIGNKIGSIINLLIDGNVYQKKCDTSEAADDFFKLVLAAKKGGVQELTDLMVALNRINRVLVNGILETDISGKYFLKGFNHPVPEVLVNTLIEYTDKGYPVDAIVNFWKLLMLNPDTQVRDGLFKFLNHYQFAITDNGYFTAYKVVEIFSEGIEDKTLINFVNKTYKQIRDRKKGTKGFTILKNKSTGKHMVVPNGDVSLHEEHNTKVGILADLYTRIQDGGKKTVYTDKHNGTSRITLGEPCTKDRRFETHEVECSDNGLHVGSTPYVKNFFNNGDVILMVLVNPANVIHVPTGESTKMRTSEYYPFALLEASKDGGGTQFNVLDQPYFETEYANYEKGQIEEQLAILNDSEANSEVVDQLDYRALLEARLIDLSAILE